MDGGVLHQMKVRFMREYLLQMHKIRIALKTSFYTVAKNMELKKMIKIIGSLHLTEKIVHPHTAFDFCDKSTTFCASNLKARYFKDTPENSSTFVVEI